MTQLSIFDHGGLMNCKKCGNSDCIKSGFVNGKQRYKCKDCYYHFTENDRRAVPEKVKAMAYVLYLEGMSFRGIERILKVSHVSVMKWVRQLPESLARTTTSGERKRVRVVEIDEMWHYVEKKREKHGFGSLLIEMPERFSRGRSAIVEESH